MANEHYGKTNEASTTPKNFFAGDFPTLTETGTAGAAIAQFAPVCKNGDGGIVTITSATKANVIGIAAEAAGEDEPVVFYQTGEFFADALAMPAGVTTGDIADAMRKLSIFLRGEIDDPTPTPSIELNKSTTTIAKDATETLTATTVPADAEVTWTTSDDTKADVTDGVVTGVAAGSATITASITVDGTNYTDTCTVTVTGE